MAEANVDATTGKKDLPLEEAEENANASVIERESEGEDMEEKEKSIEKDKTKSKDNTEETIPQSTADLILEELPNAKKERSSLQSCVKSCVRE